MNELSRRKFLARSAATGIGALTVGWMLAESGGASHVGAAANFIRSGQLGKVWLVCIAEEGEDLLRRITSASAPRTIHRNGLCAVADYAEFTVIRAPARNGDARAVFYGSEGTLHLDENGWSVSRSATLRQPAA